MQQVYIATITSEHCDIPVNDSTTIVGVYTKPELAYKALKAEYDNDLKMLKAGSCNPKTGTCELNEDETFEISAIGYFYSGCLFVQTKDTKQYNESINYYIEPRYLITE